MYRRQVICCIQDLILPRGYRNTSYNLRSEPGCIADTVSIKGQKSVWLYGIHCMGDAHCAYTMNIYIYIYIYILCNTKTSYNLRL